MINQHGWKFGVLLTLIIFSFLWLIKAPILSTYFSEKMGIEVTARTVSVWPHLTRMRHFRIANPDEFRSPTALLAKQVRIRYTFGSLISTPRIIEEIVLQDVDLNILIRNTKGTDNNWAVIASQMHKPRKKAHIVIKKLIIRNLTVTVEGKGAKVLGVAGVQHFDQMEFDNIDSNEGFPTQQLIANIFKNAGIFKYIENLINPTQRIKEALNPLNIFGK